MMLTGARQKNCHRLQTAIGTNCALFVVKNNLPEIFPSLRPVTPATSNLAPQFIASSSLARQIDQGKHRCLVSLNKQRPSWKDVRMKFRLGWDFKGDKSSQITDQ